MTGDDPMKDREIDHVIEENPWTENDPDHVIKNKIENDHGELNFSL